MNFLFREPVAETQIGRAYQESAIEQLRSSIASWVEVGGARRRERPVLSLPPRCGKTYIASKIFSLALRKGKRCAFSVPLIGLINQTHKSFERAGIEHIGIIQGDHPYSDSSAPVQICSAQTLARRKFPPADVVILDEIHLFFDVYRRWMDEAAPSTVFIGLSGSPWRVGLSDYFDRMIVGGTTHGMIEQGYLVPYRYFCPDHPDLTGVKNSGDDFNEKQLSEAMSKPKLVADVVKIWKERAPDRKTLVFGVDRLHAKMLQEKFVNDGRAFEYADAYTSIEERQNMLEAVKNGDLNGICNVGVMHTGVDAPFIDCCILARPTRSEMLAKQLLSRCLAIMPGKSDAMILDHSDTWYHLGGDPLQIEYDDFVRGKEKNASTGDRKNDALPKPCPSCSYLKPPKTRVCPSCGFESQPKSSIVHEDGELMEMTGKAPAKSREQWSKDAKQRWWSEIIWIAHERGKSQGWAAHTYKSKFGVWPRGLNDRPSMPSALVTSYVRERAKAYIQAREKEKINESPLS